MRVIYCIFCPDSVYIGRTKNIRRRMIQHGHPPFWAILETVKSFSAAHLGETFWVNYFKSRGAIVLNKRQPRRVSDRSTRPLKQLEWLREAIKKHGDSNECLLWPFSTRGQMRYGQVPIGNNKADAAHVVAWKESHPGEKIPQGLKIMHSDICVPRCFNPNHLSVGTQKQNMEAAKRLGRCKGPGDKTQGEKNGHAVLTDAKVRQIRALYAKGNIGHRPLAKKMGVCRSLVQQIVQGKAWAHLLKEERAA
jgi:hypothetical protein